MPFGSLDWTTGQPVPGFPAQPPEPILKRRDDRQFFLVESFCYRVPTGDTRADTIFAVPGTDTPQAWRPGGTASTDGQSIVVPPSTDSSTDLASVPWFMWWLVASYGNHTRAVLLHDALYVDVGTPPVSRTEADRLLLRALREPGSQKAGAFRHWLMWAAVSAFGARIRALLLGIPLVLHVLLAWSALATAVAWAWGGYVWHGPWTVTRLGIAIGVTCLATALLALALGLFWRLGVDRRGGWMLGVLPVAAVIGLGLVLEWPTTFGVHPFTSPFGLFLFAAVLVAVGFLWGLFGDRSLKGWLWPTALIGLPLAVLPVALILVSVAFVWVVDLGAILVGWSLRQRDFEWPHVTPWRYPLA